MTTRPFNPDFLTIARHIRGVSQVELAEHSGIDRGALSKFEGGIMVPTEAQAKKLGDALGFPVGFFYRAGCRYAAAAWEVYH